MLIDTELEEEVLGSIIIEPDVFFQIEGLRDVHFHGKNKIVYQAIVELMENQVDIDSFALLNTKPLRAHNKHKQETQGGLITEGQLDYYRSCVRSASNAPYYAQFLILIHKGIEAMKATQGFTIETASESIEKIEAQRDRLNEILEDEIGQTEVKISDYLMEYGERFVERRDGKIQNIPICLKDVNYFHGGWRKGTLNTIAARTSMGKSAFVGADALHVSKTEQVLFITTEMTKEEMLDRFASNISGLSSELFNHPERMKKEEFEQFVEAMGVLNDRKIIIDDKLVYIEDIVTKIRKYKGKIGIAYVDLISEIKSREKFMNERDKLSHVVGELKRVAKEVDIPIVQVHQIHRMPAGQEGKRPSMSNLKDSGKVEEASDSILILHRPEYYGKETFEDGTPTENICEFFIAKNRHGKRNISPRCRVDLSCYRFMDMAWVKDEANAPF